MIELFFGTNDYMLQAAWKKQRQEFAEEHGLDSITMLDASESDWPKLHQAISGLSLFDDGESMVILRSINENKNLSNRLAEEIEHISDSTRLLVVESKIDKRSKLFKDIKREGLVHDHSNLSEVELAAWAVDYVGRNNGKLSRNDAALIVDRVGLNQLMVLSELDKLLVNNVNINKTAIEELIERRPQASVFAMLDAMVAGKQAKAGELYRELRSTQLVPIYILTMVGWQLHLLSSVKQAGSKDERTIASDLKLSPYAVGKTKKIASRVSADDVKRIVKRAADTDLAIKQGEVEADQAVEHLILEIAAICR